MNGGSVIFNETGNHRLNTAGYMNADGGSIALRAGADSIMQHRAVIEGNGTFKEALQKPLFPSRIEQNCSVRFFFTTSKNGVFLPLK